MKSSSAAVLPDLGFVLMNLRDALQNLGHWVDRGRVMEKITLRRRVFLSMMAVITFNETGMRVFTSYLSFVGSSKSMHTAIDGADEIQRLAE